MRTDAEILRILSDMTFYYELSWTGGVLSWYEAKLGKVNFRLISYDLSIRRGGVLKIFISGKPPKKIFESTQRDEFFKLVGDVENRVRDTDYEELEKELEAAFNEAGY